MTTLEQDINARKLCKKYGIQVYGFFMMGFPWERKEDIKDTIKHIFKLNCEFIEIHLAIPYIGSNLYLIAKGEGLVSKEEEIIGKAYFSEPAVGTKYVQLEKIKKIRNKTLKRYYLRLNYLFMILRQIDSLPKLANYARYGVRFVKNI
jgi:radical SAM superfamily enzyme YgiQ (UPF0313 family)